MTRKPAMLRPIFLATLAVLTVAASALLRIGGFGFVLIICGIPLVLLGLFHLIEHISIATQMAPQGASLMKWMLLSDLCFFLAIGLQPDFLDGNPYYGLQILLRGSLETFSTGELPVLFGANLVCLIALVVTWVVLWRKWQAVRREAMSASAAAPLGDIEG